MKVAYTDDGHRQILKFLLAGDCARCEVLCEEMVDSTTLECITACTISYLEIEQMHDLIARDTSSMRALIDEFGDLCADAECYMVILGSYSAEERIAWMVLHLFSRARKAGLVSGNRMPLPLNQPLLASAVGLSLVHTNKTLAKLRRDNLITWSDGIIELHDPERLGDIGQFRST